MHARLQGGDENTGWTCGDCGELNPKFAHIAEGSGVNGVNPTKQHEDQALLKWKPFFFWRGGRTPGQGQNATTGGTFSKRKFCRSRSEF